MSPFDVSVVGRLVGFGDRDPVYDGFLLAGPAVVLALAVFGRSAVGVALAAAYVTAFVGYVLYRGATRRE